MDINMTETEKKYYGFIGAYISQHGGLGPNYREIMNEFGVSKGAVQSILLSLKKKGLITWKPYTPRSFRLVR